MVSVSLKHLAMLGSNPSSCNVCILILILTLHPPFSMTWASSTRFKWSSSFIGIDIETDTERFPASQILSFNVKPLALLICLNIPLPFLIILLFFCDYAAASPDRAQARALVVIATHSVKMLSQAIFWSAFASQIMRARLAEPENNGWL